MVALALAAARHLIRYPEHPSHDETEGRKAVQRSDRPPDLSDVPGVVIVYPALAESNLHRSVCISAVKRGDRPVELSDVIRRIYPSVHRRVCV